MLISSFYAILCEEDDEDFYKVTELLRWHHADVLVCRCTDPDEVEDMAKRDDTADLILIDIDNPSVGGPQGLERFSSLMEAFPVIAYGDRRFREDVLDSMRHGLQDFFCKWEVDRDQLGYLLARAWSRRYLITKLRTAEQRALAEGEAKSRFLAHMSHEIRTPLVSILGFSQLLAEGRFSKEQGGEFINSLQNNGRYLLALLDNVLTSSQLERGEFRLQRTTVYLQEVLELVNAVAHLQASAKGLDYSVQIKDGVAKRFRGDVTRLSQVLVNLVVNAVKYTDQGQVSLVVSSPADSSLQFTVSDTGRGISEEGRRRLFQEFTRNDEVVTRGAPGVGLGLFVAQSIVRAMGGYISVESVIGKGSTFRVVLPLTIPVEDDDRNVEETPQSMTGRVLLVEDAVDSARYISLLLTDLGLLVQSVSSAEECFRAIQSGEQFDVILMDIGLPGMDGVSAIRELRSQRVEAPILALSAHAFEEDVQACLKAGADGYLTKPFRVQDFLRTVVSRISQGKGAPSIRASVDLAVRAAVGTRPSTENRLRDIKRRFVSGLPESVEVIREAEKRARWSDIREVVHKIAGSAGLLGFSTLSDRARDAEVKIKEGETTALSEDLTELAHEVERVVTEFESEAGSV